MKSDAALYIETQSEPLLRYASSYWVQHARGCAALGKQLLKTRSEFFSMQSKILKNWLNDPYTGPILDIECQVSAVHLASYLGILPWLQALLTSRRRKFGLSRLVARPRDAWRPLHVAASCGNEAVVQLLLEYKEKVDSEDAARRTALHMAAESGDESVVRLLLHRGAKIKVDAMGKTALSLAASRGHVAVVRLLIDHNADINSKDLDGWTVLYQAVSRGDRAVVRLLLDHNADANERMMDTGRTALHEAVSTGNKNMVRLLLDHNVDVNIVDACGSTPLCLAASRGDVAMSQLLIQ